MNKERLVSYTDAVIAIAATIMVLELHAPKSVSVPALFSMWPTMLAYVISFALIYLVWMSHQNIFNKANVISIQTYLINGIWLFILTLVPFATSWVGEHPNDTLPEFLYMLIEFLWGFCFQLMDNQIIRDNPGVEKDVTDTFLARTVLYGGLVLAMMMSFFIPIMSLVILGFVLIILTIVIIRN
ncbi:integral membrane protein [Lactobacillus selangorensis]|uniref:Integral membrane protein n=1 Tax=Lactobacillus selangorensis TaxID=81857 RepID=A0A0R2FZJ4_9LACO|nr:TMEM175 family protein [Lactobacillus selangorensis]KRN29563.1 integral membrane protein [Lactobacillus selangorensis]KRN33907.1 integral membrane protein [Lactobacillus selangorensis]